MPRFRFQLDGVLRHRKHLEEQRQRELSVVQAAMAGLESQLRELDQSMQETTADVRNNRLTGSLDVQFLMAHRRYAIAMQQKAVGLAQQMAAVQHRLGAARAALVEAARQRKIIEKLRERRQAEWAAAEARKETALLDEVGTRIGFLATLNAVAAEGGDASDVELREAMLWGEEIVVDSPTLPLPCTQGRGQG